MNEGRKKGTERERERERDSIEGMKKRCYQNIFVDEWANVNEDALVLCRLLE
jgi:hypothetical protein